MAVFSAIGSAISAVSAFFGSLGAFGGAILKAVVGIGLNKLAMRLSGQKTRGPSFSVKGQVQRGADLPQSFIMGRAATAGSITYTNTWGRAGKTPNAFLTMVITLSDLPLRSLDAVWVNGVRGTIANVPHQLYGHPIPEFHRDGSDYVWVHTYLGDQTQACPMLVDHVSTNDRPWDGTAVGKDTAYVVITLKVNKDLFTSIPQVLFEVTGTPLYDPSKDSTVGGDGPQRWGDPATWGGDGDHLPAVQIYNMLRGIKVGGQWLYGMQALSPAQLPAAHWIEQIQKCRQGISGHQGYEPTYRAGGEISVAAPVFDAISACLDACQGRLSEAGGVYKLFVGAPDGAVASFSDADIVTTEEQSFAPFFGLADTVNGISGKYPDPGQGWQIETAPPLLRNDLEAEDGNRRLLADVQLDLVPYPEQVQRLMRAALNEARRARRHTFTMPPKFWPLEPGDVVSWTSERNGYQSKLFRVDGILDQANADLVFDLTEVDPSDYSFNTATDFTPVGEGSFVVDVPAPQPIGGWSVAATAVRDGDGRARLPALLVRWDSDVEDVDAVRVQVRQAGASALVFDGRIEGVERGEGTVSQSILPATDYEVRGKYVPGTPRPTEWSGWLAVTSLDLRLSWDDLDEAVWQRVDASAQEAFDAFSGDFNLAFDRLAAIDIDARVSEALETGRVDRKVDAVGVELDGAKADVSTAMTSIATLQGSFAAYQVSVNSEFNSVRSWVNQNFYTESQTDSAIASATQTIGTELDGLTTTVQTVSQSVDGVKGLYGVKINNNGAISGFGLNSRLLAGQPVSDFIVDADNFRVGKSNNLGQYSSPFQVIGSTTYIKDAYIKNASVSTLKIQGNAITVPVTVQGATIVGNGGFQHAVTGYITLPEPGDIIIFWSIQHGYSQSGPDWGYRLMDNSWQFEARTGMTYGNDYPSGQTILSNRSGLRAIRFEWWGENSNIQAQVTLHLLGRMR